MEQKKNFLMYGLLTGIVMALISLAITSAHLSLMPGVGFVTYIPFVLGMILCGIAFSKANDGFVTFGNVFANCFKAAVFATLVMVVWVLIQNAMFPNLKEEAMTAARDKLVKDGKPDDQIEMALNIARKIWFVALIGGAIIGNLFFGAIFSLIGAAVAQKKGPNIMTPENM